MWQLYSSSNQEDEISAETWCWLPRDDVTWAPIFSKLNWARDLTQSITRFLRTSKQSSRRKKKSRASQNCLGLIWGKLPPTIISSLRITSLVPRNGDFYWAVNSHEHFFSKRANSSGHFSRLNSKVHVWWILADNFVYQNSSFLVNFRGHILGEFYNGDHCSVSGLG